MTTPDERPLDQPVVLRDAAGSGYAGEWALFCDYTAATRQPALPTTTAVLLGFLATMPARPATQARRVRAIAAAHRRDGHLLARPDTGPAAAPPAPLRRRPDAELMIASCPTRGWPAGLAGRRDAFLIVLTEVLDYTHTAARALHPSDITIATDPSEPPVMRVEDRQVPDGYNPRTCPTCTVARWLDILGVADGLGRGSARTTLAAAHAPTAASRTSTLPADRPGGAPPRCCCPRSTATAGTTTTAP